jgi:hypothetical protein
LKWVSSISSFMHALVGKDVCGNLYGKKWFFWWIWCSFLFFGAAINYLFIYLFSILWKFFGDFFLGKRYVLFSIKLGFKRKISCHFFFFLNNKKNSHSISQKKLFNIKQIFLFNFIGPLTMLPTRRALKPM